MNKPSEIPSDNQVPMVIPNDKTTGDGHTKVTADSVADVDSNTGGRVTTSSRENNTSNTDSGSTKRELEESDFTRPQEELAYIQ